MQKSFYVTTPIYYVNDAPHIGHAYTSTLADVLTRFHQLYDYETFFLTGTDEHGQKVQQAAEAHGVDPQAHVDEYNLHFKELWKEMDIEYDHFIRTTDPDHKAFVQKCLQDLWDKDEIYAKEYEGWYSVSEERFFSEDELIDGKDPIGGKDVEWIQEKNYFFKMGQYQQRLIDYINDNPKWILPDFRKNEVLGFLRQPLQDLCISRPANRLSWGIPLPFDADFVTYVWFDALINYVSAVQNRKFSDGSPLWPASLHLIGKDILTTHCVYWPTMLMALGIELPQHILAHGWWLNGGAKMSKSTGNVVNPTPYMENYGVDSFRYFLIRDMVIGQDATFSDDAFFRRINADLANDLGNGLNRVHKMTEKNFAGEMPSCQVWGEAEDALKEQCLAILDQVQKDLAEIRLSQMVEEIMGIPRAVNRYLEQKAPWHLAKDPEKRDELATVMWVGAEALRLALALLSPIMPQKSAEGLKMLGLGPADSSHLRWGVIMGGEKINPAPEGGLFPRIQLPKTQAPPAPKAAPQNPLARVDLRVAQISAVEDHPNADSLYKLSLKVGAEERTVCAGLKSSYSPADLQDRLVILFANLKSTKLRGIESQGMLLAADGPENTAILLEPPAQSKAGDRAVFDAKVDLQEDFVAKIKDLDRLKLKVENQRIISGDFHLQIEEQAVLAAAKDGAKVR